MQFVSQCLGDNTTTWFTMYFHVPCDLPQIQSPTANSLVSVTEWTLLYLRPANLHNFLHASSPPPRRKLRSLVIRKREGRPVFTVSLRSLERIDAPNFLRHLMMLASRTNVYSRTIITQSYRSQYLVAFKVLSPITQCLRF